ncbi:MAG: hypothetical protein EZS28_015527, partial [Streblomastix strix]
MARQSHKQPQQQQSQQQEEEQTEQQAEQQQVDNIEWSLIGWDYDGDSSLGGGYESVRWRPPEYQGLSSNWDQYIMNKLQTNKQQENQKQAESDQNENLNTLSSQSHLSDGISNELSVVFSLGIILWEIVTSEI